MTKTKKLLIAAVCLVAILTTAVVGTIAWLTDKTATVTNTFSPSTIKIELTETKGTGTLPNKTFKMVPGTTIDKDPVVTVKKDSEACWLFVKIDKVNNFDTYMTFAIADGWKALPSNDGVYYRQVAASAENQSFNILGTGTLTVNGITCTWSANQVLVRPDVTKADMDNLYTAGAESYPTLNITAYAIQSEYFAYGEADEEMEMAAVAWAAASAQATP